MTNPVNQISRHLLTVTVIDPVPPHPFTSTHFFDGHVITAAEHDTITNAAFDRYLEWLDETA